MKRIFLIRHAEPLFTDGIPICMGRKYDLPLSENGHRQAAELASHIPPGLPERLYTSPLRRCVETAVPIVCAAGLEPVRTEDLAEMCGGVWDGLTLKTMHEQYPEYFTMQEKKTPPGGESDEAGLARILSSIYRLAEDVSCCGIAVTHAGIGRLLLSHLLGCGGKRHIRMEYASVTPLIMEDGELRIDALPMNGKELDTYLKEHKLC